MFKHLININRQRLINGCKGTPISWSKNDESSNIFLKTNPTLIVNTWALTGINTRACRQVIGTGGEVLSSNIFPKTKISSLLTYVKILEFLTRKLQ